MSVKVLTLIKDKPLVAADSPFSTPIKRIAGFSRFTLISIISEVSGTPTFDVKPQLSGDKENFADHMDYDSTTATQVAQQSAVGNGAVEFRSASAWLKAIITLGGTTPTCTITVLLACHK